MLFIFHFFFDSLVYEFIDGLIHGTYTTDSYNHGMAAWAC